MDEHIFDNIDTPEKAYWLGFIAADGNINNRGTSLNITVQQKDSNILVSFLQFMKRIPRFLQIFVPTKTWVNIHRKNVTSSLIKWE